MAPLVTFLTCILILTFPMQGSYTVKKITAVIFILFAFRFIYSIVGTKISKAEKALAIFVLIAAASALLTYNDSSVITILLLEYGGVLLLFTLVYRSWASSRQWILYGMSYLGSCVLTSLMVMKNWLAGVSFEGNNRYSLEGVNNNYISYTLATSLPIVLGIYWSIEKPTNRHLAMLLGYLCTCLFAILLTGSRGATVAYVVGIAVASFRSFSRRPVLGAVISMAIPVSLYLFIPSDIQNRLLSQSASIQDVSTGRFEIWPLALLHILQNPVLGNGAGFFSDMGETGVRAHNFILNITADLGLLGLGAFMLAIWYIFKGIYAAKQGNHGKWLALILLIVWLPISLTGVWELAPPAWFAFAWLYRLPITESEPAYVTN